jgi:hypothetical protein
MPFLLLLVYFSPSLSALSVLFILERLVIYIWNMPLLLYAVFVQCFIFQVLPDVLISDLILCNCNTT